MDNQIYRYTMADIVFFLCMTPLCKRCCKTEKESFFVQIPFYAMHKLNELGEYGIAKVHEREIVPLFFSDNEAHNREVYKCIKNPDHFKSFVRDIELDILQGGKRLWIFGPKEILYDLAAELDQEYFPKIFMYSNDENETPVLCEVFFDFSEQQKLYVPRLVQIEELIYEN